MKTYQVLYLRGKEILVWDMKKNLFGIFSTQDKGRTIGEFRRRVYRESWDKTTEDLGVENIQEVKTDQPIFEDLPISASMPAQP